MVLSVSPPPFHLYKSMEKYPWIRINKNKEGKEGCSQCGWGIGSGPRGLMGWAWAGKLHGGQSVKPADTEVTREECEQPSAAQSPRPGFPQIQREF